MKTFSKAKQRYHFLLVTIIIILTILVGFLSYTIIELSKYQNNAADRINSQYLTEPPPENSLSQKGKDMHTFTHPGLRYSVDFLSDWNPQLFSSPTGRSIQPYRDFIIYSPGYDINASDDTSLGQQKNASILVRAVDTHYTNIEDKFRDNLAAQKIARNIIRTEINGVPAIQYDYSFKNENATVAVMIKNNLWYFIRFQYDNEEIKRKYMEVFQQVLNSLKLKQ